MAEFKLSRFKYTWEGEWSNNTRYNPDQIISFGGKVYVSLETHTSNANFYADLEYYNNDSPPLLVPKWELIADGVSWKGNWSNNTYYVLGDSVKYGGTVYLCINAHTSSPAQLLDEEGNIISNPGLAAFSLDEFHWTVQVSSKDWKIDWNIATYYKLNDIVRYGGIVYRCNESHESAGDFDTGLEGTQSSWDVVSVADDWTGSWTTGRRYKVNDLVKYGGNVYKCEIAHVSASSEASGLPADQAKWSSVHVGVEYRGNWTPYAIYKQNDIVKYGSYTYISIGFHEEGEVFAAELWTIYCPGNEYDVAWSTTNVYQPGDIVQYGGNLYAAIELSAGQNPSTVPSAWELLFENSRIRGDWNQIIDYKVGDVVRRGGNVFLAHKDSTNQDPDIANDGSTTNEEYWDLLIPGIQWRGVWSPGEIYIAGDTVVWVSSSYRCLDKHISNSGNRPDDDGEVGSTLEGRYWAKITDGNKINRLKNIGDIRTFGPTEDGSTIGYKALEVGTEGFALTSLTGESTWDPLMSTSKVYYVAEFGQDVPTAGTSPQSPWRTVRYATENITGVASIFVRTGVYDEVLPIRVPAFVAIIGDELRSTVIQPGNAILTADYITRILAATDYIKQSLNFIIKELPIGNEDLAPDTILYGIVPQDFSGTPATDNEVIITTSLFNQFATKLTTGNPVSINGTNELTIDAARLAARAQVIANRAFIKNEVTLYIDLEYNDSVGALGTDSPRWSTDLDRILDAVIYDMGYIGNYKTIEAANYFLCASDYNQNKIQNMFLLRDGTGLRNCTLRGLEGTLSAINQYGTRRPTAGAYASLDPGWGVGDTDAWVGSKSPYVQNVTTFGTGCVGLKIDGNLHSGGNQTIVCNDFTQILSDGIGVWANGAGRTECVSIFTYYNHIGYLSTTGGRIRGTNGNCSYGTYGAVSEGYNIAETPIIATVNNRYYEAATYQTLCDNNGGLLKLFYTHAGNNYTAATATIVGSGSNGEFVLDDIRDGAVSEVRITNRGDSSADGGSGYVFATNSAQGGDDETIQLAGSDENEEDTYRGMRVVISSGTGVGQYGYIAEYEFSSKTVIIGLERQPQVSATQTFNAAGGNEISLSSVVHLTVGDAITFTGIKYGNIADNTVYYVKTINTGTNKITISALANLSTTFGLVNGVPTGINPAMVLHCVGWQHFIDGTPILALLDSSTNYYVEPRVTFSSPGFSTTNTTLPANRQWTSIAASSTRYVAVALDTAATAYSDNGSTWSTGALPTSALWTKVKYVGGIFMAFASAGQAARSTNGTSWTSMTMSATAEWRDVAYGVINGVGTWVAVASGSNKAAKSTDGATWSAFNLPEGADWNSIEFGKGKFVTTALSESSATGAAVAYTSNATTWTLGVIPQGSYSLAYGNNRFVALSGGYAGATEVSTSFDGVTWTEGTIQAQDWRAVVYAQGVFLAVSTASSVAATSIDGKIWQYQSLGATGPWCSIAFSNVIKPGKFIVLAGLTANSTAGISVSTGKIAQARVRVVAGRIAGISLWDIGSGYTSAPVFLITDPNNSSEISTAVRLANGVLGPPTIVNAGTGYETLSTTTTISGDGYKDEYQIGSSLVISGLDRLPGPGDNIQIVGITDYTYKLLTCEILEGAFPNATARLVIAKDLGREESPEHETELEIRQQYSQVRLTGHDFLDVGLGNFEQTNYPQTLFPNGTVLAPEDEIRERDGGRVFYTSTDQDGNFRVGELFAVEQATGTVTLNAQFFQLEGLEELRLGGVTVGGSGVVIREFSTDGTFTADSNNIIPTQKAVKAYLQRRVSGGGADAITGQLTAGTVRLGPDTIATTTGDQLIFGTKVVFNGGIDGTWLALNYFTSSGG